MNILIALLVIGIIVFLHELGHFLAAKTFKIPVSDFAVGMGPELISIQGEETNYALRLLPIGGYVNIEGMEYDSKLENGFNMKPAWQKFIVLIAGIFMNFLTALVILFFSFKMTGAEEPLDKAIIGQIAKDSPSYSILHQGDKILEIEGIRIESWQDISKNLNKKFKNDEVNIKLLRNDKEEVLKAKTIYNEKEKRSLLGITPTYIHRDLNLRESFILASKTFIKIFKDMFTGFKMLFSGKVSKDEIAGPIGLIQIVGQTSQYGFYALALMVAVLSINIGFINLIPIPALDGGRIIFVILESIGVKVNKKFEDYIHRIGMVLLFSFIFIVSINDILKFFR